MKKIIDLIKSLLSPGSLDAKKEALDLIDKEAQKVVENKEKAAAAIADGTLIAIKKKPGVKKKKKDESK